MEGELKVYFYDTEAGARQIEATVIPARASPHVRRRPQFPWPHAHVCCPGLRQSCRAGQVHSCARAPH